MMVGIEFLVVSILFGLFSGSSILSAIHLILSLIASICYYWRFKNEYKKLDKEDQARLKVQLSYKLIIVFVMIFTINLVYPLGIINLILAYALLIYFVSMFIYREKKKLMLNKLHLMNFNYLFDVYSILCLCTLFWDVISYAI